MTITETIRPAIPVGASVTSEQLRQEQARTLSTPRMHYGFAAKVLFLALDAVYGRRRTLAKFKVLEVVARVPYQAWEHVAYIALTHRYRRPAFARRVFERVHEARAQQDNEQWHLLVIEELLEEDGERTGVVRSVVVPQALAFVYYQLSWMLFVVAPRWSYSLNAQFEDHAEHEYAHFVLEHPELEAVPYEGMFATEYGAFASTADLFRRISLDERAHKEESLGRIGAARFR